MTVGTCDCWVCLDALQLSPWTHVLVLHPKDLVRVKTCTRFQWT